MECVEQHMVRHWQIQVVSHEMEHVQHEHHQVLQEQVHGLGLVMEQTDEQMQIVMRVRQSRDEISYMILQGLIIG